MPNDTTRNQPPQVNAPQETTAQTDAPQDRRPDPVRVGVLLPTGSAQWGEGTDPRDLVPFALRAEELGFGSLFVNDSLLTPRIEPLTMLAALAPLTHRTTLGTGALLPFLRRPVQAAQSLASIDLLSGGRLAVAVGAGFPGRFGKPLYDLSGVPWERRFKRLDETVRLWRQLWTADGPTSFHGELLQFDEVPPATRPFAPGGPPIWLGGATPPHSPAPAASTTDGCRTRPTPTTTVRAWPPYGWPPPPPTVEPMPSRPRSSSRCDSPTTRRTAGAPSMPTPAAPTACPWNR
ncbi:LLM class flavin-dependent oxidoreductase [Kitasatospora paranensis]|uniref:LLM class flavin-dependent oxidoreductase n=1 Tax=Kitasatospora paranensis TaxID=258053 RepID=UPI0031EEA0F2